MSPGFRPVGERTVWTGSFISVAEGDFVAPDGSGFRRDIVHHPGAVAIVPLLDDDRVVLVRQYRAPCDLELLEIPAGKLDVDGEPPEAAARRELVEETGWAAGSVVELARFYNSAGISDELTHVYLGRDLAPAPPASQGVEEHFSTVETVALDDVPRLIAEGELIDAKTIVGLTLTLRAVGG